MYSMTGFGKGEAKGSNFELTVEIKTVNHRFKDLRFKMGSVFNAKEMELRKKIDKDFRRGSFDIYVNYKRSGENQKFDDLDEKKINSYLNYLRPICEAHGAALTVGATDFLRPEFMMDKNDKKEEELYILIDEAIDQALSKLKDSRREEGESLRKVILNHCKEYSTLFSIVENNSDSFEQGIKEKIEKKFLDHKESVDKNDPRFMQEVIYYMEKIDIHEEINRIKTHLEKMDGLVKKDGEVGRQIDFLLQEINRETNTIGSKSSVTEISEAVIKMKSQLEKIREQALNIE